VLTTAGCKVRVESGRAVVVTEADDTATELYA
jgi:hypothetical protein